MASRQFEDLHVVVTGAGGSLGSVVVERLLEQGATCHLPLRRAPLASRRSKPGSGRVHVAEGVDLADEKAVRDFFAALPDLWASIHCAGAFAMAPVERTSLEELGALWRANAVSAFLCCREAARVMRAAGNGGRIVNLVARPALEPRSGSGMLAYTASKAAVAAMTQALAEELAPEGIWVNAVAPSIIDTQENRRAMPQADHAKWATPDQVAATIAFLASPRNGSTRGALVPVYGKS